MHCIETKASYLLRFFNKTSASVLFLEFQYFELRNIYKRILSPIRIPIFSSELASLFIDSGAGLVLSIWFVLAVVLNSESKFIVAKLTVWVWCGVATYNEQTNHLCVYRCLLQIAYVVKQLNYVWLTAEITA